MQSINITDDDISYAEKILLNGASFDEERRIFIKDLETLDLQAVPGSGKTTALLAKLLLLEKKLSFDDNSGILVISHTNTAVNEIKQKLQICAPKLFTYPSFIGTIQSFVDTFLTIPYFTHIYGHKPHSIDDEKHDAYCDKAKKNVNSKFYVWLSRQTHTKPLRELTLGKDDNLTNKFSKLGRETPTWKALENFKRSMFSQGILRYNEAFDIANWYLEDFPQTIKLLQKRFSFVFVDEMQDMSQQQQDILEKIFFDNGNSTSIFQRIGDNNQSIYDESNKEQKKWEPRAKQLKLCGSHRLSPNIAKVVEQFAVDPQTIVGLKKNSDGSEIDIKPYIFVYEEQTKQNVIPRFLELIKELKETDKIKCEKNERYAAIGFVKEAKSNHPERYGISSFYPNFMEAQNTKKENHNYLWEYFQSITSEHSIKYAKTQILNGLQRYLFLEGAINPSNGKYFTSQTIEETIRRNEQKDDFNLKMLKWCLQCIQDESDNAFQNFKEEMPNILNKLGVVRPLNLKSNFLDEMQVLPIAPNQIQANSQRQDLNFQVCTIHSVKGESYTGILYLETFYRGFNEAKTFHTMLSQQKLTKPTEIDAAKLMYVGFSRPTHLLCFAVQKDRFESDLGHLDHDMWNIIEI